MKSPFENKTIVLSGASGGIGRALCKILITQYGANVIGIGRSEEKMRSLSQELGELGDKFSYRLFDVSIKENWVKFALEVQESGCVPHLLINNAVACHTCLSTMRERFLLLQERWKSVRT